MAVKINLAAAMKPKERILDIPVEMIVRNPNQPRKIFEEGPLFELAESIRVCGIIQPLNVRKTDREEYELCFPRGLNGNYGTCPRLGFAVRNT